MVFHSLLRNTLKPKYCKCDLLLLSKHSRMVSSYGIQTGEGIFEIKKSKTNAHEGITNKLAWMNDKKYLEIYQCEDTKHPVEQLLTLHKFEEFTEFSKLNLLKGFIQDEGYLPSIVHMTNGLQPNGMENLKLTKTLFEILDNGTLALLSNPEENDKEYYLLQEFDGPHPVFKDSKFAPVYKNFDQAKDNLSKVVFNALFLLYVCVRAKL